MRNHLVLFLLLACPLISAQATHYPVATVHSVKCIEHNDTSIYVLMPEGIEVIIGPDPIDERKPKNKLRTLLRIHPARGSNTKGCIGIQTNDKDSLKMIERIFKSSLIHRDSIPLGVTLLDK